MRVKNTGNTALNELAQAAADILDENEELILKCNRARSAVILPKNPANSLVITSSLKERLLSHVIPRHEREDDYVFYDRAGRPCCISLEVMEKAHEILHQKYPQSDVYHMLSYGVVDIKTDIELMPADTAAYYSVEMKGEAPFDYPLATKENERLYVLLKNKE